LPVEHRSEKKLLQVKDAVLRLVRLHGREVTDERAIHLTIWPDPDGKYLIKGGGLQVWKEFGVRNEHRRLQGLISGKRCGVMGNIGAAARRRWRGQQKATIIPSARRSSAVLQA
jgi:hypothetical protein